MIIKHKLETFEGKEVHIVQDTEVFTEAMWEDLSAFWCGHKERNDGTNNYKRGCLRMIADLCLAIQVSENFNTYGVMKAFDDLEGYPKMDGSVGLLITYVEDVDFETDLLDSIKLDKMPNKPNGNF